MEGKDPANRTNLEAMGYTPEVMKKIDKFLKPEIKELGEFLFTEYRKSYDKYNETYRKIFGVSMPSAGKYYAPRFVEGKEGKDMEINDILDNSFNDFNKMATNSHQAMRVENSNPLRHHDALATFTRYHASMERFHHFSEPVRELNAIFGKGRVRDAIRQHHGSAYNTIMDYYVDVLAGNFRPIMKWNFNNVINTNAVTKGMLFMKPAIGIKQTFSTVLFGSQMPTAKFALGLLKFGQKGIVNIRDGVWLKTRGKAYLDYTHTSSSANSPRTKFRGKLKYYVERYLDPVGSVFIKYGDRAGAIWGGQVYADYQYKQYRKQKNPDTGKKYTHQEAHDKALQDFEVFAEATQQSFRATNISYARGHGGDLLKPFTMFTSAMVSQNLVATQAAREGLRGKNKMRNAKIFLASHILLGQIFSLAGNGLKWDDDKQRWALIKGNFEGLFMMGKALSVISNEILGEKGYQGSSLTPLLTQTIKVQKYIQQIYEGRDMQKELTLQYHQKDIKEDEYIKRAYKLEMKEKELKKKLAKAALIFSGTGIPGAIDIYDDLGTVYRDETDTPTLELLGITSPWSVGRELTDPMGVLKDIIERGPNVTSEHIERAKLQRNQKVLYNKIFKSSGKEKEVLIDEYEANAERIKKLTVIIANQPIRKRKLEEIEGIDFKTLYPEFFNKEE